MFHVLMHDEHPQTIALVLSCLSPGISRTALLTLPKEKQADIAKRMTKIKNVNEKTLYEIENYIKEKMTRMSPGLPEEPGGIEHVVETLKGIVPDERKKIIASIKQNDTILGEEIEKRLSHY